MIASNSALHDRASGGMPSRLSVEVRTNVTHMYQAHEGISGL